MGFIKNLNSENRPPEVKRGVKLPLVSIPESEIPDLDEDQFGGIRCSRAQQVADRILSRDHYVAHVMVLVSISAKLSQIDLATLLAVSRVIRSSLMGIRRTAIWRFLDFNNMNNVEDRLVAALSMPRFHRAVEDINLEFARDIEDKHIKLLSMKRGSSVECLESLNLNGCKKISEMGVKDISENCPRLKHFSINGNLRVTDFSIKSLAENCKFLTDLNLSGCKKLTNDGLVTIGKAYHELESLDITRCEQITDVGVVAIAEGCPCLKFLSLSRILGVTDRCLEILSKFCSSTLTNLVLNGCTGIEGQTREQLLQLFPKLQCFSSF